MDFLNLTANEVVRINEGKDHIDFDGYMKQMPAILVPNYFYQNEGNFHFNNKAVDWGIDEPTISQSAAYADFYNDGDLDYLNINLKGNSKNPSGIWTKIHLYAGEQQFFQGQFPVRGFQSTVDLTLNFGLGDIEKIDYIVVVCPTDEQQVLSNISTNQTLIIDLKNAKNQVSFENNSLHTLFQKTGNIEALHQENQFTDFKIQSLLPWFFSKEGPGLAVGDVNNRRGKFTKTTENLPKATTNSISVKPTDMDNDGDVDLFIGGGYLHGQYPKCATSQLLINNDKGKFTKQSLLLPTEGAITDAHWADLNGDAFPELIIVGEWMPVTIFENTQGTLKNKKIPILKP
jgi:hypothetical protein